MNLVKPYIEEVKAFNAKRNLLKVALLDVFMKSHNKEKLVHEELDEALQDAIEIHNLDVLKFKETSINRHFIEIDSARSWIDPTEWVNEYTITFPLDPHEIRTLGWARSLTLPKEWKKILEDTNSAKLS